jgi:hypothetical protein
MPAPPNCHRVSGTGGLQDPKRVPTEQEQQYVGTLAEQMRQALW